MIVVESVKKGSVEDVEVIDGGGGYRIGDQVNFNQEGTNGAGFRAEVSEIVGKNIIKIETDFESYSPCVFVWDDDSNISAYYTPGFDLRNRDTILVGNISTSITNIFGPKIIGFSTQVVGLAKTMSSYTSPGGVVEDIFVSSRPNNISIGNSIFINSSLGDETVKVLNDYQNGILRVKRFGNTGAAHTYGS